MSKINLTDLSTITGNETSAINTINNNSTLIETFSDNTLSRDGTSPNQMLSDLDMNSNRVLNLPVPVSAAEPLRLQDLSDFIGTGTITAGAPTNASYVTLGTNASLTEERVLTAGTNITLTDAGAGSTITVASATTVVGPGSATDTAVVKFNGTTGKLVQNSGVLIDSSNNLVPATNDGGSLGTTALKWSDLFLASGSVINWNSGDVTLTHSADSLAFLGAATGYSFDMSSTSGFRVGNTNGFQVGNSLTTSAAFNVATDSTWMGGDWIAWFRHEGSAANNESLIRHEHFSNFAGTAAIPQPVLTGIGNRGTISAGVTLANQDYLLVLDGRGYDGTITSDTSSQINFRATQTWTNSAHGSQINLLTTPNSSITPVIRTTIGQDGVTTLLPTIATPAGGSVAARLLFGTTAGFGIYYGSGLPTVSAAQGSLYLRSDGSSATTRLYVNNNGTTGWTNMTSPS